MTDFESDPESGRGVDDRPPDPVPTTPGPSPANSEPRFSRIVTLVLSVLVWAGLFCTSLSPSVDVGIERLERPVETTVRVFERDLAIDDALTSEPSLAKSLVVPLLGGTGSTRAEAIEAFEDVLRRAARKGDDASEPLSGATQNRLDGVRARRAILLAESGRVELARGDLDVLARHDYPSFLDALRRAYSKTKSDDTRAFADYDVSLAGDGWIGDRLRLQLARVCDARDAAADVERTMASRDGKLVERAIGLGLVEVGILLVGVVALLTWLARDRPESRTSTARIPPAWPFETGYAVLVRAAVLGAFIEVGLSLADLRLSIHAFALWGSFFAGIPLFFLVRRALLAPRAETLASTFGLTHFPRPLAWIAFTLAVFAIDQLGGQAIQAALGIAGVHAPWAEHIDEVPIWSSRPIAMLDGFNSVVWAPIVEEIGFRGVLFLTLRQRFSPWRAALLSAAMFGVVHVDSLPGLLTIAWSGFVWAMAFERCRSLVPGIACHALNNLLALTAMWLFYR